MEEKRTVLRILDIDRLVPLKDVEVTNRLLLFKSSDAYTNPDGFTQFLYNTEKHKVREDYLEILTEQLDVDKVLKELDERKNKIVDWREETLLIWRIIASMTEKDYESFNITDLYFLKHNKHCPMYMPYNDKIDEKCWKCKLLAIFRHDLGNKHEHSWFEEWYNAVKEKRYKNAVMDARECYKLLYETDLIKSVCNLLDEK